MSTVLVVDDSAVDRRVAEACVQEEGFTSIVVDNGRAALKAIEENEPDLVLTDLLMPEMDGLELVQEIKGRFPAIPVVLMTAHMEPKRDRLNGATS